MLHALTLWAAVSFGGAQPATVDFGGNVVLEAPVLKITHAASQVLPFGYASGGLSIPHVAFVDPNGRDPARTARHEMVHLRQFDALGPGVVLGLAVGGGEGFEDYVADGVMYDPTGSAEDRSCPVVRVEGDSLSWFPCWRPRA